MKVLADLHHGVLWEGLAMLFEDRYGWEMRAWVDGYYVTEPGWHWVDFPPREITCLTTEEAREWQPDIVLSTVGGTRSAMHDLSKRLDAVYVDHVGNQWDGPLGNIVLRSVADNFGSGVLYHPEFHRVPYKPPVGNRIGAFHNSLLTAPACLRLWNMARELFPDWEFVLYGTPETALYPYEVAGAMRECAVIWHDKEADGYGFTVHEAFATGRPVVGHNHYREKLAGPLWTDRTAVTLHDDVVPLAGLLEDAERRERMGIAARSRFEELVNFDAEAAAVHEYLSAHVKVAA